MDIVHAPDETTALLAKAHKRAAKWEQDMLALRGRLQLDESSGTVLTETEEDELDSPESETGVLKVECDSSDEKTHILLEARPMRLRRTIKDERRAKEAWFSHCIHVETVMRATHEAAKVAVQEKVEAVKESTLLCKSLRRDVRRLERKLEQTKTESEAAFASLRRKYKKAKGERNVLREKPGEDAGLIAQLRAKIAALEDDAKLQATKHDAAVQVLTQDKNRLAQSNAQLKNAVANIQRVSLVVSGSSANGQGVNEQQRGGRKKRKRGNKGEKGGSPPNKKRKVQVGNNKIRS
ncbi:SCP domain-containing protein [Mycena indigotica]|uniref:SCP domain-containing protein n=1 Tax=Mycena indigotica TaxID=2126181 RepID=A0A8H6SYE6_9AGAR|nr:SCP domain-containing protein [Mycena indigotica]KAF7306205.1 SCP domain-containing protein [Mycena indigotica]